MLKKFKDFLRYICHTDMTMTNYYLDNILRQLLLNKEEYNSSKCLIKHGYKLFSQSDEDGIIDYIFKCIEPLNKIFVEIGVGDGLENNTLKLLVEGWRGYWIEGNEDYINKIKLNFTKSIEREKLKIINKFISKENIEETLIKNEIPKEFDLLSIDIDGNDFWVWEAIENFMPKVVVIEYNAEFGPSTEWVMKYDKNHIWEDTCCYGTSLKALENLGNKKGYSLVGCNLYGVNAFFIRSELAYGKFLEPFTSEMHYEAPKYGLIPKKIRKINPKKLIY